jgi:hypothetical protein
MEDIISSSKAYSSAKERWYLLNPEKVYAIFTQLNHLALPFTLETSTVI